MDRPNQLFGFIARYRIAAAKMCIRDRIKGAGRKKLRLRAGRFDLALIDNNDLIGVRNGGQPVGDDQQRLAPHQPSQCRLDDRLVFRDVYKRQLPKRSVRGIAACRSPAEAICWATPI